MASAGRASSLRWMIGLAALCLASMLVSPTRAHAQAPRLVSYQGHLATSGGAPVSATLQMTFKLYDGPAGAQVWSETQTVQVSNGIYSVVLGSNTTLPANFTVPYWLGVTVGTDAEMTPRQPLVSVPYALYAASTGCKPGDMVTCYSGTLSTLNVGPCKAGVRSCDAQGIAYGNCTGEITPAGAETCGNAIDDNCSGAVDEGCTSPNGSACTLNAQCTSTFCSAGTCCNTACNLICQTCVAGGCQNAVFGTDPRNDCPGAMFCNGAGACVSPNGSLCSFNSECASGSCVDGFCCNSACNATCMACSSAKTGGSNGICTNIPAGTDPDNECAGALVCSGAGTCQ